MDEIESQLQALGKQPAFEVDWAEYERSLVNRLLKKERQKTVRYWGVAISGMLAGAAATIFLTTFLSRTPTDTGLETVKSNSVPNVATSQKSEITKQSVIHNSPLKPAREKIKSASIIFPSPVEPVSTPVLQTIKRPDGKTGFIRFIGFSEDPQAPEIIKLPGQPPKRVG